MQKNSKNLKIISIKFSLEINLYVHDKFRIKIEILKRNFEN